MKNEYKPAHNRSACQPPFALRGAIIGAAWTHRAGSRGTNHPFYHAAGCAGFVYRRVAALRTLLVVTITGIVPGNEAFAGFGHPAVITVAAVLIIGRGLLNAGVVSVISRWIGRVGEKTTIQVGVLTAMVTFSSAFMNN